ncbi:hypothetical protein ACIBEJ_06650 [Nonomuraea sp. NPDC050790]|uniref:hypothetical protein n=1 Tax=Nonomuraea sp. NPDC050790 TaxID=3364371 RepID=UPI003799D5FB
MPFDGAGDVFFLRSQLADHDDGYLWCASVSGTGSLFLSNHTSASEGLYLTPPAPSDPESTARVFPSHAPARVLRAEVTWRDL